MTISHLTPLVQADGPAEAFEILRSRGLRLSAARRLVVEAMYAAEGLVSAEAIASGLDGKLPACDLASVYRNLETLERVGLVRHLHVGHGPGLYSLASVGEREYLACERCDAIMAITDGSLDGVRNLLRERFGFEARFSHFPIVGLCADCAARQAHSADGGRE